MKEDKIQVRINPLYNFGYIRSRLPKKIYNSLLKECLQASKNKKLVSGLSHKGVPKHYCVEKNRDSLISFIKEMHKTYEKSFPGLSDIKVLTDDLPFSYDQPWINLQKQNEFVPIHLHEGIFSYSILMKIPYDSSKERYTGNFEFIYCDVTGAPKSETIQLSKKDEGTITMFPAKLQHIVWPFYKNKGVRISVNGNITFNSTKEK